MNYILIMVLQFHVNQESNNFKKLRIFIMNKMSTVPP